MKSKDNDLRARNAASKLIVQRFFRFIRRTAPESDRHYAQKGKAKIEDQ